jgi:antirestriction protein ArdC
VLKEDKRAIFTAASHAQKAADFLHGLQPEPEPEACPQGEATPTPAEPQAREFERLDH